MSVQTQTATNHSLHLRGQSPPSVQDRGRNRFASPLKYEGLLESYPHFEVTPSIGREFDSSLQLTELLNAPNAEELVRDLSVLISRRGVCFFRDQDIQPKEMLRFAQLMGEVTGKPKESKLVIHPVSDNTSELGDQITVISAARQAKGGGIRRVHDDVSRFASVAWHSDVSFEKVPSDYSMLKINVLPETGGDTFWNNMYEAYERMSPSMQAYMETLTATHSANFFHEEARRLGITISKTKERGNPINKGDDLEAHHPIVRTNPVTGWKALFINKGFTSRIDDVTKDESDVLLNYLNQLCIHNMDMQVRFRWQKNSLAIWDNRSTQHSATFDYGEERSGDRASGTGELPFLDPASITRSQGLKKDGHKY
ncbi:hypothetical protein P7C73_g2890, partial [Tremellales sp. Uapishka_1]